MPPSPYANDYAQAGAMAKGQLDPLVAALASQIQQQTTAGIGAIKGYTGQLASSLSGEQQRAQGIWGAAQQAQAASDAAFAQRLSGGGAQLAGELSSRLASVNAPEATGQTAANVQQTGAGAGNAAYGMGSAAMGQLISQGASAQEYAGKLPGLAQLGGIQAVREFGLGQQARTAEQSQQLLSQAPGLQNQALSYISGQRAAATQEKQQAAAAATQQAQSDRAYKLAAAKQRAAEVQQQIETTIALGYDPATGKLTQKAQNDLTKLRLEQKRIAVQQRSIEATNQRTAAQIEAANARAAAGQAGQDRRAAAQIQAANARAAAARKTTAAGLTAGQRAQLQKDASSDAETFYYGVPPKQRYDSTTGKWVEVPNTGTPAVSYQDAIKRLRAKYPSMSVQEIQALLNNYYAPGEDGRPGPKPTVTPGQARTAVSPPTWAAPGVPGMP